MILIITDCNDETYGYDCANNCSRRCINGSPCNKHTGFCDEGCKAGFTNVFCSESKYWKKKKFVKMLTH